LLAQAEEAPVMHGEAGMATDGQMIRPGRASRWTLMLWGGAAVLLSIPFIAMRFTSEVNWTASDFVVMGIMLAVVCGAIELAVRFSGNRAYRFAVAAAIGAAFLITWANLAVGIVGSDDNPANVGFFYALLVGMIGSTVSRFRAGGMALTMLATAAGVAIAFVVAVSSPTDEPNVSHWRELIATSAISSPLFVSAWLFRKAARR
jgi:hypothetical protein